MGNDGQALRLSLFIGEMFNGGRTVRYRENPLGTNCASSIILASSPLAYAS